VVQNPELSAESGEGQTVRLPSFERDFWRLRSGEQSQREHPDTFWMPPLDQRQNVKRGQAVRLIFEIEAQDEQGVVHVSGERMWVIVAERVGDVYIGILDNQPACLKRSGNAYLRFGAEVPFQAEHVIDIADPPQKYVDWQLGQAPERYWPRE
jgi:hypothetical protein